MNPVSHKKRNRSSLTRSLSVAKLPILTNVEEESEDQVFNDTNTSNIGFFAKPIQSPRDRTMGERPMETPYNRRELSRREILKARLKYHFMNPLQKYKVRKRKPWKLLVQIFKIIIVTAQVGTR